MRMKTRTTAPIPAAFLAACALAAAETPALQIDAAKPGPPVGLRYGLMTEEINFSYGGGLYGALVPTRAVKEHAEDPVHWSPGQEGGAAASISPDPAQSFNPAIATSDQWTGSLA